MSEKVTALQVAQKMDREGEVPLGWFSAGDIDDPKLAAMWREAEEARDIFLPLEDRIAAYLYDVLMEVDPA